MSKITLGLISGLVFGALDVSLMLPMSFPGKTTALLGAFTSRFAIGLVIRAGTHFAPKIKYLSRRLPVTLATLTGFEPALHDSRHCAILP
jgi:hypothetical protein